MKKDALMNSMKMWRLQKMRQKKSILLYFTISLISLKFTDQ